MNQCGNIYDFRYQGVDLNREGEKNSFLRVDISIYRTGSAINFTQTVLIEQNFQALGIEEKKFKSVYTQSKYGVMPRDLKVDIFLEELSYARIVGIIIYMTVHSRPDIAFVVN